MAPAARAGVRLRPSDRASMHPDDGLSDNPPMPADPGRAAEAARSDLAATAAIDTAGPAIELDGLGMRCGGAPVLEDITLTVRRQEIFGLLGPNGAGKTSLLKAILLLEAAHAGTIRLFGEPHRTISARPRLAYLPQRFQPPGDLTGRDFVRLTLAFYGSPGETRPDCRAGRAARVGPERASTADQRLRQEHGAKARSAGAVLDRSAAARAR